MENPISRAAHGPRQRSVVVLAAALMVAGALAGHAAEPDRALSFVVLGDWGRDGKDHQRDVARQMSRVARVPRATFVISTGDNFYNDGVSSVRSPQWQTSFENIYSDSALQIPWYVVLGNHDHRSNPMAEVEYTHVSPRWRMPAPFYSQLFALPGGGSAEFFFLDTQSLVNDNVRRGSGAAPSRQAQLSWLDSGLAASSADWKFVVGHHPVRSEGFHGDTRQLLRDVKPLLERHGVQVYLNGHDHDMQHIVVNGVHYVTSGAGSRTRPGGSGRDTRFSLGNTSGFLAVELTQESFAGRFIDWTGKEVYAFKRSRVRAVETPAKPRAREAAPGTLR